MYGHVVKFHAEAAVGFARAVTAYRITIFHALERAFHRNAGHSTGAHHHLLDHAEDGVLRGKRYFEVELRELGLAVGAQIFVTEAFDDLEVAVHASDHQYLLEDLGRLRHRVALAGARAALIPENLFPPRRRRHGARAFH